MILGIDQSYTETGIALVGEYEDWHTVATVKTKSSTPWIERIEQILDAITDAIMDPELPEILSAAALEGYAFGGSFKGFVLGELGGLIKWHCYKVLGVVTYQIVPQHHKMYVARRGNATKKQTLEGLQNRFGIELDNENEADSLSMALLLKATLNETGDESRYDKLLFEKVRNSIACQKK